MNIAQCQQSPLTARPGFVRFTNLNDELNRLFETTFTALTPDSDYAHAWSPALDVYEDNENFVVQAELPGLKREDMEVSLHDGTLTISGERKAEKRPETAQVYRAERSVGRFQRALVLPDTVAADRVKAGYTDGVLTVTLPKTEAAKPKKIDVSVN
jgi:HSP20 family protein